MRDSLADLIAILRARIDDPPGPPPRLRRVESLPQERIDRAIRDGELRTDCTYTHGGQYYIPIDDQPGEIRPSYYQQRRRMRRPR